MPCGSGKTATVIFPMLLNHFAWNLQALPRVHVVLVPLVVLERQYFRIFDDAGIPRLSGAELLSTDHVPVVEHYVGLGVVMTTDFFAMNGMSVKSRLLQLRGDVAQPAVHIQLFVDESHVLFTALRCGVVVSLWSCTLRRCQPVGSPLSQMSH
jgi:hypothetical protein